MLMNSTSDTVSNALPNTEQATSQNIAIMSNDVSYTQKKSWLKANQLHII